jgi:hypothetical protein
VSHGVDDGLDLCWIRGPIVGSIIVMVYEGLAESDGRGIYCNPDDCRSLSLTTVGLCPMLL